LKLLAATKFAILKITVLKADWNATDVEISASGSLKNLG